MNSKYINYNIHQNINQYQTPNNAATFQTINPINNFPGMNQQFYMDSTGYSNTAPSFLEKNYSYGQVYIEGNYHSPYSSNFKCSLSPNDSTHGSFNSCGDDSPVNLIGLRPQKKSNSSSNLDINKKHCVQTKRSVSLFMSGDKEEKGEDYNDLQELLSSINVDLWEYAKSQKGSR
jgi:hypothetical protein